MPRIIYSPFMEKWVAILEEGTYPNNFLRGRTIGNNQNKMQRMRVRPGLVSAEVFSSGYSYNHETRAVKVKLPTYSDAVWEQIIARLAQDSAMVIQLLAGRLPADLTQICTDAGVTLLPTRTDLVTDCEFDGPYFCKHTIGVCYKMGLMIDADPFVLLTWRGRSRDQLLTALGLNVAQPATTPIPTDLTTFWQLDNPWPQLQTNLTPFADEDLPLANLGNPPDWHRGDLSDELLPLYQHIRKLALTLLDLCHRCLERV